MGNQLFAAALLAAGIAAALVPGKRLRNQLLVVAFLALGAASFGERSSLILPAVAVIVTLARTRMPWRATIALAATVGVVLLGWQIAEPVLPGRETGAGAALAPLQGQATDVDRAVVWRVTTGSIGEHPLVGWGPGTTQVAYLSNATPADIAEATRRVGRRPQPVPGDDRDLGDPRADPARGAVRAADRAGVASGSGAGVEPGRRRRPGRLRHGRTVNLVLTPLLFLFAAMAAGLRAREPASVDERTPRGVRLGVGIVLSLSLVVSLTMIAGATFERWGREYGEEWAYRAALRVQPWRLTSTEQLALQLAAQGRTGDQQAGAEAKRIIAEGVERFPWDVNVRLWAADVDTLLNDPAGSRAWRRQHVERFPADETVLTDDAPDGGFTLPGEEPVTGG